jgi:hypothetical protein
MVFIAPTRRSIERRQRRIEAEGSSISLLDALIATPCLEGNECQS